MTIDAYLLSDATDKKAKCREVLAGEDLRDRSKAASWLAYRAIESGDIADLGEARGAVGAALDDQANELDEFWRARWRCSLAMALAYLQIAMGDDARPTLAAMHDLNWIAPNPPGAVNICRAHALLAAIEAQAGNFTEASRAIDRCHTAFKFAASLWLPALHACRGGELELAAKAVHITLALLPHAHRPFRGFVRSEAEILAIDTSEPFNAALRRMLSPLRALNSRNDFGQLIDRLGLKVGAELGVARAGFSNVLLRTSQLELLTCIDKWDDESHPESQRDEAAARLGEHGARAAIMHETFADALPRFPDGSLDFIYVDGYAHTGQESGQTLRDWWPKLRAGGVFAGHDYHADWPQTVAAVDAFAAEIAKPLWLTAPGVDPFPSWYFFK